MPVMTGGWYTLPCNDFRRGDHKSDKRRFFFPMEVVHFECVLLLN